MASELRNYPDYVFVAYDDDFSAQTYDIAVSLEPGNLVGRPVKYIRHDLNTRPAPAATDTGLVTVKRELLEAVKFFDDFPPSIQRMTNIRVVEAAHKYIEQAEELLAAAHDEKMFHVNDAVKAWNEVSKLETRVDALEADNAAQAARINDLEEGRVEFADHYDNISRDLQIRNEALEAKLAAAEKALIDHNDILRSAFQAAQRDAIYEAIGTTNYSTLADRIHEVLTKLHAVTNDARAVLGGKP